MKFLRKLLGIKAKPVVITPPVAKQVKVNETAALKKTPTAVIRSVRHTPVVRDTPYRRNANTQRSYYRDDDADNGIPSGLAAGIILASLQSDRSEEKERPTFQSGGGGDYSGGGASGSWDRPAVSESYSRSESYSSDSTSSSSSDSGYSSSD